MTNWRWWMVVLLFVATTVNYLDRQVLSLTWKDFIAPEFHWTDNDYGTITAIFSISESGLPEPAFTQSAAGLPYTSKATAVSLQ